jgi:hypothetical protein
MEQLLEEDGRVSVRMSSTLRLVPKGTHDEALKDPAYCLGPEGFLPRNHTFGNGAELLLTSPLYISISVETYHLFIVYRN